MANTRPTSIHSLNGDELRALIEQRVKQGILQAMNLRGMYSFPLVRYKITIEVLPFRSQGRDEPLPDDKNAQRCVIEGQEFIQVVEDSVELIHDSPILGWDKDPQEERAETGLGKVETRKVEGQYVDVSVGRTIKIEEPQLPPQRGREAARGGLAPDHKPVDVNAGITKGAGAPVTQINPAGVPEADAKRILEQEAETWKSPSPDPNFHDALASERELPGRISVLKK
jgi:hypothetical protein